MSRHLLTIASALTRLWTRLYTTGMPPMFRDGRRREVECDLWELVHDAAQRHERPLWTALHMLARAVLGGVDDVSWRFEHMSIRRHAHLIEFVVAGIVVVALVVASLVYSVMGADTLPTPPAPPTKEIQRNPPPPPPPPPPGRQGRGK